jgi:gas vesicle protein
LNTSRGIDYNHLQNLNVMNTSSKVLLGIMAGAAIGGALGILLAPDKGAATRKRIIDKGSDVSGAIKDKFNDVVDGVKGSFTRTKEDAKNALS